MVGGSPFELAKKRRDDENPGRSSFRTKPLIVPTVPEQRRSSEACRRQRLLGDGSVGHGWTRDKENEREPKTDSYAPIGDSSREAENRFQGDPNKGYRPERREDRATDRPERRPGIRFVGRRVRFIYGRDVVIIIETARTFDVSVRVSYYFANGNDTI